MRSAVLATGFALAFLLDVQTSGAQVITGTIDDWQESGPVLAIGDGVNDVHVWWSINTLDKGWFYGSNFTGDSDVAHAVGVTAIGQIVDASSYTFTADSIGPLCDADCDPDGVGEFVVWRNTAGYYGVLRLDDIKTTTGGPLLLEPPLSSRRARLAPLGYWLDATWWFQTDGTAQFSGCTLELAASYTAGTLTLDFEIGNPAPSTWNLWLSYGNDVFPLWSLPIPSVEPPVTYALPIAGFPQLGTVGFLTTLVTPGGIACGVFRTVDTGVAPIGTGADELLQRFPGAGEKED